MDYTQPLELLARGPSMQSVRTSVMPAIATLDHAVSILQRAECRQSD